MASADSLSFQLGRTGSECVRIKMLRRNHPTATDFWDANWLSVRVQVRAGGFEGRANGDLRAEELAAFRDGLARLHQTLKGEASFETMETWLSLRVTADGLGHMQVRGEVRDAPGTGNRLTFALALDQTDLPELLEGLDAICREFPAVGER